MGKKVNKGGKEKFTSRTETIGIYLALMCGGLIVLFGIYLTWQGQSSRGVTLAGRTGIGGGESISLPGWGFLFIGALFFIPGLVWLIMRYMRRQ